MKLLGLSPPLFIICLQQATAFEGHGDIDYQSSCNDSHITYEIPVPRTQSNVLRLRAGTCNEENSEYYNYDDDSEILQLSLPFSECGLKEYSDEPKYTRSSTYFSSTIEIVYGIHDEGFMEVIFHTTALAVQCEIKRDYVVEFNYDIVDRNCTTGERLIDGICVWFGDTEGDFDIFEYTDDSYSEAVTDETRQSISGEMIYLGIVANSIPRDFTWGVENCYIVKTETNGNQTEIMFFDPAGTTGILVDGNQPSCSRNSVQLSAYYHSINPEFRLQHLLFMLEEDADAATYMLRCHIKLCCIGNEAHEDGSCEATDSNDVCEISRDTCGGPPAWDNSDKELSVTLTWDCMSDLDLWVMDPSGEEIGFSNMISASNGTLDVDQGPWTCDGSTCDNGYVENTSWYVAPSGNYEVSVNTFDAGECTGEPFSVTVNLDGAETTFSGVAGVTGESFTVHTFSFTSTRSINRNTAGTVAPYTGPPADYNGPKNN